MTASPKNFTHDANGNLTGDGTRTFEWDAENRLTAVVQGALRSEFTYDGQSRRVRIVEKNGAATTSDKRFLWCDLEICEERNSTGGTVTKRFFGQGVQEGGTSFFYARDHLGSLREMTDSAGTLRARYDYDPWGRRTKLSGDKDADFGYTGHYEHTTLTLAPYRGYDATVGRWINEDPIGLAGGDLNLYKYVLDQPTGFVDPTGREPISASVALAWGGALLLTALATTMLIKNPPVLPPFPMRDPLPPGPPPQTPVPRPAPGPPPSSSTGTPVGTSTATSTTGTKVIPLVPKPRTPCEQTCFDDYGAKMRFLQQRPWIDPLVRAKMEFDALKALEECLEGCKKGQPPKCP